MRLGAWARAKDCSHGISVERRVLWTMLAIVSIGRSRSCIQVTRMTRYPAAISAGRGSVALECGAVAVVLVAVYLDDQALLRPQYVDDVPEQRLIEEGCRGRRPGTGRVSGARLRACVAGLVLGFEELADDRGAWAGGRFVRSRWSALSVARRWTRASVSADSASLRGSVAARSQIVRAGVVSVMPSLSSTSSGARSATRWMRMPVRSPRVSPRDGHVDLSRGWQAGA